MSRNIRRIRIVCKQIALVDNTTKKKEENNRTLATQNTHASVQRAHSTICILYK